MTSLCSFTISVTNPFKAQSRAECWITSALHRSSVKAIKSIKLRCLTKQKLRRNILLLCDMRCRKENSLRWHKVWGHLPKSVSLDSFSWILFCSNRREACSRSNPQAKRHELRSVRVVSSLLWHAKSAVKSNRRRRLKLFFTNDSFVSKENFSWINLN